MKQAVGPPNYPQPQKSTYYALSKYTTSNTTELNSKCLMSASPKQFHQPKRKSGIVLGTTHETPKDQKTKHYNR